MTLAEAGEIFAYWGENPPAHLLLQTIARLFGWAPPPASAAPRSVEDIATAAPPGLVVARGGALDLPAPLDLQGLRVRNQARAIAIGRRNRRDAGAR